MPTFDEFHAEVTGAIALADFVNGDNAWMLKTGGGFRFATETLQMRFGRPVPQADDFERHCAIQTFLSRAIDDALTAAPDFLQQFVIAKISEHFWRTRSLLSIQCWHAIVAAGVADPGYRFTGEQTEARLQQTGATKFLRRVGENLRAALCTDFGGRRHIAGRTIQRPNKYCRKSSRRLRAQYGNQMAQLIFDIARRHHRVGDFLAQQLAVTLAQAVERLLDRVLGHAQ